MLAIQYTEALARSKTGLTALPIGLLRRQAREQLGELLRKQADRKELLDGLFQEVVRQDPAELKARLQDKEPDIRLVAVRAVADRRLHFEDLLIGLLDDPSPDVAEAAQHGLVRLSRGNNFGPSRNATAADRAGASRAWLYWLLLQDIPGQPSPEWLAQKLRTGRPDLQDWLLDQLRDWPREDATTIVARTIPLLTAVSEPATDSPGAKIESSPTVKTQDVETSPQQQLRRALARRLSKLAGKALQTALASSDAEIRRAAIVACALREEKGLVPALIAALKDREAAVAQAAHQALRELTGQDLGPAAGASAAAIDSAAAAWLRWWQNQASAASAGRGP
jgi:hypothetical protein